MTESTKNLALIEKQMHRDYTSNWSHSLVSKLSLAKLFRATFYCVPHFVLASTGYIGAATLLSSAIYADELPARAQAPDEGMPPSPSDVPELVTYPDEVATLRPYTNPANLRFRPSPLRNESNTQNSEVRAMPSEVTMPLASSEGSSLRMAAAGDENEWQVQHDNPLRKGGPPKKGLVSPSTAKPVEPVAPSADTKTDTTIVADKPLTLEQPSDSKPPAATTQEPFKDVGLVVPSRPTAEEDKNSPSEMASAEEPEETVLHLGDDLDKPAPLPPGIEKQPLQKVKPEKGFDPEDNDQPSHAGPGTPADSDEDPNPSEVEEEPQSSELLRILQENSALESPDNAKSKAGRVPIESPSKSNPKTPNNTKSSAPAPSSNSKPTVAPQAKQPIKVLPQTVRLRPRIDAALNYYLLRPESNVERSPWAVFHAILPFGSETTLKANGRTVSAINWMCYNGSCRGQRIFIPQKNGSFQPAVGAGVQGHEGQFLAILAQSRVPANYPLQIGGKQYTVEDLIDYEMRTCKAKTELTFKLIALSHYLINDATWVNDQGEEWSLERLVEEELAQPIIGAACGGTHRLMGLSFALKQRKLAGLPIDGQYARAEVFLKDFVDYAWTLQNPDGSFSTEWFEGRGNKQDLQRKLQTTGHIVEWLVFTLPDEELQSPRLLRSIEFLTYCLVEQRQTDWKIGPRSHALHALAMYQERLFGVTMGTRRNLATGASRNQRR